MASASRQSALADEDVAPGLERVGPVRATLVGGLQLGDRAGEVAVAGERDAPGIVAGRQVGGDGDGLDVGPLGAGPVAAVVEDVAVEAVAVDVVAARLQRRVGLIGVARHLLGGRDPAGVAGVVAGDDRIGIGRGERLHLGGRARRVAGLGGEPAVHEVGHRHDVWVGGVVLEGLDLELGVGCIMQARVDVRDLEASGSGSAPDALV